MWKHLLKSFTQYHMIQPMQRKENENRFRMNSIGNSQFPSLFRMFIQAMKIFWRMKWNHKKSLGCFAKPIHMYI